MRRLLTFMLIGLSLATWLPPAVSRTAAVPEGANLWRDVPYGQAEAQRLDVYAPARAHGAPVILMVHGGAWAIGGKDGPGVTGHKMSHWLEAGYIFVSIDYRMLPAANPLEQARDVAAALAYVQHHAAEWGGDGGRVVLAGHSAGAHLVALLAADPALARESGADRWLGTITLDSAALDVPSVMEGPHLRLYDRAFGADPAFWARTSPLQQLHAAPAPMLLVCSSQRAASCPASRAFAARVEQLGGKAQVLPEPMTHAQINADLGAPGDYTRDVDAFLRSLGLP